MQTCKRCLTMFNYSAFSTVCSGMLCGADGQEGWVVVCMSSVMHNTRMWPWCSAYHHNLSMGICQATMHTIIRVWVYVRPPLPSPSPLHLPGRCWLLHGCRLHAQECCTGGSTLVIYCSIHDPRQLYRTNPWHHPALGYHEVQDVHSTKAS